MSGSLYDGEQHQNAVQLDSRPSKYETNFCAWAMKDEYSEYTNSEGMISWQYQTV